MRQKTIVITGGTDGIGAAAARQLASLGHRVIVTGRSREKAERLAKEAGVRWFLADYTRLREVARLAAELREAGPIDVLCNNAGGIASAIAVLMIIMCFGFAILVNWMFKERNPYGAK